MSGRTAFRPAEVSSGQVLLWLGGLGGLVLVVVLFRRLTARRKQARAARVAFQRVLAERGLSAADEALVAKERRLRFIWGCPLRNKKVGRAF